MTCPKITGQTEWPVIKWFSPDFKQAVTNFTVYVVIEKMIRKKSHTLKIRTRVSFKKKILLGIF